MLSNIPHMGQLIQEKLKEAGMTKAEFGRRINTSRQNVNTLLRKEYVPVDTLLKVCRVLQYNFFEVYMRNAYPPKNEANNLALTGFVKSNGLKVTVELSSPEDLQAFLQWWNDYKGS